MKRSLVLSLVLGVAAPVVLGTTISWGASTDTECWDEYNNRGTRLYRTVTPKGADLADCDPGVGCFWGYSATKLTVNRIYVPHGADPKTACDDTPTTTIGPPATLPGTTLPPQTTVPPAPDGRFGLLSVGADLPSDAECAGRVRPMTENRPENATMNATAGTSANDRYQRVTGDFTGTTDEIIQWTACKWGIDEDWVRAQISNESLWNQSAIGDFTSSPDACAPGFPIGDYPPQWNGDSDHNNQCPESIGLGQVRWLYHDAAFEDDNATKSSAYNLDYTYAVWRSCYEGEMGWLNDVDGQGDYAAGDAYGCFGVWFSGRWYTDAAVGYIDRFEQTLEQRTWEQGWFPPAESASDDETGTSVPVTIVPVSTDPTTTVPVTADPTTTVPTTTVPVTTAPTTTAPPAPLPSGVQFVETFDNNTGRENLNWGVYHRDVGHHEAGKEPTLSGNNNSSAGGTWSGDHDLSCGGPSTQRQLRTDFTQDTTGENGWLPTVDFHVDELLYTCRNHMMTSMGDVAAYSIVWFSPAQVFPSVSSVCFDVNLTDLGSRQWIKVGVVSDELYNSTYQAGWDGAVTVPGFVVSDVGSADLRSSLEGSDRMIATWSGGASAGYPGALQIGNTKMGGSFSAGSDKATRHPVCLTDNGDGTVTFDVATESATKAGSFPDGPVRVVFYDHNYTPDKDNPIGHTFHWDNIVVN